ncbi:hypothetical protein ATANTOWER_015305 [Ataeniobius toweri]|uniref:Uncharacterized protein n=1 Tax=Ataeniobius toweri TaxID=208326 RepID=A0ABU7CKK3_9TELE|nr:hypothetical protein [Ataeniobius toweri]
MHRTFNFHSKMVGHHFIPYKKQDADTMATVTYCPRFYTLNPNIHTLYKMEADHKQQIYLLYMTGSDVSQNLLYFLTKQMFRYANMHGKIRNSATADRPFCLPTVFTNFIFVFYIITLWRLLCMV